MQKGRKIAVVTPMAMAFAIMTGAVQAVEVPGPLVSPEWLAENLDKVTVLQTTSSADAFVLAPEYGKDEKTGKTFVARVSGHIPGAVFVDYGKDVRVKRESEGRELRGMVPVKSDWEAKAQSWGVNQDDAIIIVSDGLSSGDVTSATRTYWTFKYYGHDNMAILDGGLARWLDEGHEASVTPEEVAAGNWTVTEVRENLLASAEDVRRAAESGDRQLIDGRSYSQYLGHSKSGSVEHAGHVPGARPFPIELYTRADGASARFLPAASYVSLMTANGIDTEAANISYCNTGNVASAPWFILHELLGNENAALYDASMHEYSKLDGVTFEDNAGIFN